jgi:hypothetical protein
MVLISLLAIVGKRYLRSPTKPVLDESRDAIESYLLCPRKLLPKSTQFSDAKDLKSRMRTVSEGV